MIERIDRASLSLVMLARLLVLLFLDFCSVGSWEACITRGEDNGELMARRVRKIEKWRSEIASQ